MGSVIGPLNNWALLVAKVSLWFHKNEKKNPVLHVKERPLRGENPSAEGEGGGGLGQFALTFFLFRIFLS